MKVIKFGRFPLGSRRRVRAADKEVKKSIGRKLKDAFGEHFKRDVSGQPTKLGGEKKGLKKVPIGFDLKSPISPSGYTDSAQWYSEELARLAFKKFVLRRKVRSKNIGTGRFGPKAIDLFTGRKVASIPFKDVRSGDIDFYSSILTASRRFSHSPILPLKLSINDLMVKVREKKLPLLMVIVLDTSESMAFFSKILLRTINQIKRYLWESRNQIALVECKGHHAKVILYPTTNLEKIKSAILKVKFGGATPLPDGLYKALQVILTERRKNKVIVPIVLLVSDGLANIPLDSDVTKDMRDIYGFPSYADILAISDAMRREGVPVLVLNPYHFEEWGIRLLPPPSQLLKRITEITDGGYIGLTNRDLMKAYREEDYLARLVIEKMISTLTREGKNV